MGVLDEIFNNSVIDVQRQIRRKIKEIYNQTAAESETWEEHQKLFAKEIDKL